MLFVSHNMNAVESLCTTALCLESGGVRAQGGDVRGVIARHLGAASGDGLAGKRLDESRKTA